MDLDFQKSDGLVTAVIQDYTSGRVLMVGFMNEEEISTDCDQDALLIRVEALGPGVCHNGYQSCFYRRLEAGRWVESEARAYDPDAVYGSRL
jgi:phosphoribosyl-AMP cyclohydrolase